MSKKKSSPGKTRSVRVAVLMGSESDYPTMKGAVEALKSFGLECETRVLSAHRTPDEVVEFAKQARREGYRILIAGAGGAAHLPGMLAAHTELPVIGVPVAIGALQGQDALLSIVQMPKGVPVATVSIGGAWNAGVLAAQMLAMGGREPEEKLADRLLGYKQSMRLEVLKKKIVK